MFAFGTLGRYFGVHFAGALAIVFATLLALIAIVDFFEFTRRLGERGAVTALDVAELVLLRLPAFSEQMLPFAVLIAAMGSFLVLSRRNEFVVARSAGVSVWQFTAPALVLAALLGAFATTVYSPLLAATWERAGEIEAAIFNRRTTLFQAGADGIWLRQQSVDGHAIVQAQAASDQGRELRGVRIFAFDHSGRFTERIDARAARLEAGAWALYGARVTSAGTAPQDFETYLFSTNLTAEHVRGSLGRRDALSFWDLPAAAAAAERAGLRTERYWFQHQTLLVQPFLLATMVVIAAAFSLKVFRLGGIGRMILGGVVAGFLLYVIGRVAEELGVNGIINPAAAAWIPVVLGGTAGTWILLQQEDG
jgi:lipopolysaccharide export system permease protein